MLELIREGGWVMWPILLCSVTALGIVLERLWTLRAWSVCPEHLLAEVWLWLKNGELDDKRIEALRRNSPLGCILAAGLAHRHAERERMKEAIEDTGRHVVHELGRHLNALGTIAAISPLLGLLGSVLGIMRVFSGISAAGSATTQVLSAGIAEALITTAAGIMIAVPTLILYRYFRGKVDDHVVRMEADAIRLIEALGEPGAVETQRSRPRKKAVRAEAGAKRSRQLA